MGLPECDECRAILAELVAAIRALTEEMESRLGTDAQFAEKWRQARKLETEEDVVLAEELFPAIQLRAAPQMSLSLRRMRAHEARTGHKIRRLFRQA